MRATACQAYRPNCGFQAPVSTDCLRKPVNGRPWLRMSFAVCLRRSLLQRKHVQHGDWLFNAVALRIRTRDTRCGSRYVIALGQILSLDGFHEPKLEVLGSTHRQLV